MFKYAKRVIVPIKNVPEKIHFNAMLQCSIKNSGETQLNEK